MKFIIHSIGSAGEPEVFEPYTRIRLPGIFGDVGRRSEALWERRSLDASAKGPWSRAIQAGTSVVWMVTMPGARSPLPSMVRPRPVSPALIATQWTSSLCWA